MIFFFTTAVLGHAEVVKLGLANAKHSLEGSGKAREDIRSIEDHELDGQDKAGQLLLNATACEGDSTSIMEVMLEESTGLIFSQDQPYSSTRHNQQYLHVRAMQR